MAKSKIIDFFLNGRLVMKMKKVHLCHINLRNFMRIQKNWRKWKTTL